jgi:hypothetical protein
VTNRERAPATGMVYCMFMRERSATREHPLRDRARASTARRPPRGSR